MIRLEGTWFVVPTPFHGDGGLDLESLRRLIDRVVAWGVDGITALGVTSEVGELSEAEREAVLATIAGSLRGRVPLVVGCSADGSTTAAARVARAAEAGASAAMVASPPAADPEGVPSFFEELAGQMPLLVQDEPAATGVTLPVPLLLEAVRAAGSRAVKLEDPPTAPKIAALLSADPGLSVFGGLGGAFALPELRAGASGTMTGFAFPEILRGIREALAGGDEPRAAALFDHYLPLIQFEAQPGAGLAVRKELLRRRGAIATATVRRGRPLDPVTSGELDDVLGRLGVAPSSQPLSLTA